MKIKNLIYLLSFPVVDSDTHLCFLLISQLSAVVRQKMASLAAKKKEIEAKARLLEVAISDPAIIESRKESYRVFLKFVFFYLFFAALSFASTTVGRFKYRRS